MEVTKDTLVVTDGELYQQGKMLGRGDEGSVFNYRDRYAIKIFTRYKALDSKVKLERKLRKISAMFEQDDPNVAFPMGYVSSNGREIDGYYTRLVAGERHLKDFDDVAKLRDIRKQILLLKKGEEVLKRLHKQDIILGDIKEDNILLDGNENPVYIDTDNYKYKKHFFDLIPTRAGVLYQQFGGPLNYEDNDKLLYAIMALHMLTRDKRFSHRALAQDIQEAAREAATDRESREALEIIFSDATDKPYVGSVLEKVRDRRG